MSDVQNTTVIQNIIVDRASKIIRVVHETQSLNFNPNPTSITVNSITQTIVVPPV